MSKRVGMVAMMAAMLSQGLYFSTNPAGSRRSFTKRTRSHVVRKEKAESAKKKRKARKRAENKARAINYKIAR